MTLCVLCACLKPTHTNTLKKTFKSWNQILPHSSQNYMRKWKRGFFILWYCQSEPPLWLHLGEERVRCEQNNWLVRNQHGRHSCSFSLQHLPMLAACLGQAWRLVKSKPNNIHLGQDPQRWLLEKHICMFQIDLFQCCSNLALYTWINADLYLDVAGQLHFWTGAILQRRKKQQLPYSWPAISLLRFSKTRKQAPRAFFFSLVTQQNKTGFPSEQ